MVYETKIIAWRAEVNSRCFHWFTAAAMFVPLRGTPTWRFHTELCKFQSNVSANNSTTEHHTDLRSEISVVYKTNKPLRLKSFITWIQSLGFFHWLISILISYGVTVKTENTRNFFFQVVAWAVFIERHRNHRYCSQESMSCKQTQVSIMSSIWYRYRPTILKRDSVIREFVDVSSIVQNDRKPSAISL